jgi:hypothetical protein
MTGTANVPRERDGDRPTRRPLIDEELADQLLGRPQAEGAELLGPDGLLSQVTRAVLERALTEEMTGHLGYGTVIRGAGGPQVTGLPSVFAAVGMSRPASNPARFCEQRKRRV